MLFRSLDFQDTEFVKILFRLFTNNLRLIDADRVCRRRDMIGIQSPDFVPRLPHEFSDEIVQGYVNNCFCGRIVFAKAIDIPPLYEKKERSRG